MIKAIAPVDKDDKQARVKLFWPFDSQEEHDWFQQCMEEDARQQAMEMEQTMRQERERQEMEYLESEDDTPW